MGARGFEVRGVVRSPGKGAALGVQLVAADLGDPATLERAFAGASAVVANAALSTRKSAPWSAFEQANLGGVENTLRAAAAAGVPRVVLISTIAVYRAWPGRPNPESTPLLTSPGLPLTPTLLTTNWRYSLSKARGEALAWRLAAELGLQLTVLRPGPIYGPRDTKMTAMYAAWMRRSWVVAPTVRLPHVHASDVAGAVAGALSAPTSIGRAYNTTGASASVYEALTTWKRLAGRGPRILSLPVPLAMRFDDSAAVRDLGFSPRSLEDGIRDVLAHPIATEVT